MTIDNNGFRIGIAVILVNDDNRVFWAKRIGQNAWQFPQGGILEHESSEDAMLRELHEETGLESNDVKIIASSKNWLYYYLPINMIRRDSHPLCVGQKQKWFLLRLIGDENNVSFDVTDLPEFDAYRWVYYWSPIKNIIAFKRQIYRQALREFSPILFKQNSQIKKYPYYRKSIVEHERR